MENLKPKESFLRPKFGVFIKILMVAVFVFVYFTLRFPFYTHPVIGEEGIFANLYLDHVKGPGYTLVAKVGGKDILVPDNHPWPIYEIISAAGKIAGLISPRDYSDETKTVFSMRFVFSIFQFSIYFLLFLIIVKGREIKESLLLFGMLIAVQLSPLAVASSIQLRMEGSVGALMVGAVALALAAKQRGMLPTNLEVPMIFAASFLLGLGRQEWAYPFIGAVIISMIAYKVLGEEKESPNRFLITALAGCVAGNIGGYLFDPVNYIGGLKLILGRAGTVGLLDFGAMGVTRKILLRLWMIFPALVLALLSLVWFLRKRDAIALLNLLFPSFLLLSVIPGVFSDYYYYRLYAPSLVAFSIVFVALFPKKPGKGAAVIIICLLILSVINSQWFFGNALKDKFSITDGFGWPVAAYFPNEAEIIEKSKADKCVPKLPNWTKYRYPKADFVVPSLDPINAEKVVSQKGGILCK